MLCPVPPPRSGTDAMAPMELSLQMLNVTSKSSPPTGSGIDPLWGGPYIVWGGGQTLIASAGACPGEARLGSDLGTAIDSGLAGSQKRTVPLSRL